MRRRSGIAIVVAVAIIVVGGLVALVSLNSANDSTPSFARFIADGEATIQALDGKSVTLKSGDSSDVHEGDTLRGAGTLTFAGATLYLAPQTAVTLTHYTRGGTTRIDISLKAGQILQQIDGQSSSSVVYTVTTSAGSLATHGGKFLAFIDKQGATAFGSVYGSASINAAGRLLVLSTGQGMNVMTGIPPGDPALWSPVKVTTYQPDGTPQTLPLTLADVGGNTPFYFTSGQPLIVPPGTYDLRVRALIDYQAHNLILDPQSTNEFSVTMGQAVFTTVNENGTPIPYSRLTLKGDQNGHAVPEQSVLISPGSSTLVIADENRQYAVQPVPIDVVPGQKATIPIRTDLFGGGHIRINVSAPEGVTIGPMTINVYASGAEDGTPVDTFSSDAASSLLPPGDYVVIMPADIAGRFPVTIGNSKDVSIDAGLGTLSINYTDASGLPAAPFMYVAAADAMQRLNLPIDKMNQTKFGKYARSTAKLLLPAGTYNIRVDDPRKDVDVSDIEVQPRQNVVLPVSASASN